MLSLKNSFAPYFYDLFGSKGYIIHEPQIIATSVHIRPRAPRARACDTCGTPAPRRYTGTCTELDDIQAHTHSYQIRHHFGGSRWIEVISTAKVGVSTSRRVCVCMCVRER